jgi:hypothetical protein
MKRAQERPQVNFRPTPALKKRLDAAAKQTGVALNAEIIRRLEQSFINEGISAVIENTVLRMSQEMLKEQRKTLDTMMQASAEMFQSNVEAIIQRTTLVATREVETAMFAYVDARMAADRAIQKEKE